MSRFTQVGLDRLIRINWLERVACLALAGNDVPTIKAILKEEIKESFQSKRTDVRGSLDKTLTILMKIWLLTPPDLELFRMEGIELLKRIPEPDHLPIQWGMVMAVYPFWFSVAMQVGRLLKLQGTASATQVQRRVREQYGERETVSRRVRYVLRSFLDWGVLHETNTNGVYTAAPGLVVENLHLIAWLTEAALHTRENGSAPLRDLLNSPSFFPFRIKSISPESIRAFSSRLDIVRHGLDEDLVILKKSLTNGKEN
jgi:hypothetical protein